MYGPRTDNRYLNLGGLLPPSQLADVAGFWSVFCVCYSWFDRLFVGGPGPPTPAISGRFRGSGWVRAGMQQKLIFNSFQKAATNWRSPPSNNAQGFAGTPPWACEARCPMRYAIVFSGRTPHFGRILVGKTSDGRRADCEAFPV